MTAYTGQIVRIAAGCDTAWNRTKVSVMTPQALRCSALDRCATLHDQPMYNTAMYIYLKWFLRMVN